MSSAWCKHVLPAPGFSTHTISTHRNVFKKPVTEEQNHLRLMFSSYMFWVYSTEVLRNLSSN